MAKQYFSEFTTFLDAYKVAHPDVAQRQRDGRARLWDKPQDTELQEAFKEARVDQKPYVYQND